MNRANQNALVQATNQRVLSIRQSEFDYYVALHMTFGTQAALLCGFVYCAFTINYVDDANKYVGTDVCFGLYFCFVAATICFAVHVIMCTLILQVFGPGLAIYGPLGSMVRAIEGMKAEQEQVITAFILMILCMGMSTVWMCWVIMNVNEAFAATAVFAIAVRQWYFYCERIYLRFYWNKDESDWSTGDLEDSGLSYNDEPGANFVARSPIHGGGETTSTNQDDAEESTFTRKKVRFPLLTFFGVLKSEEEKGNKAPKTGPGGSKVQITSVAMEGYFTTKGKVEIHQSKSWERRYFVLLSNGNIFIYDTRHDFRTAPKEPIYVRPLKLNTFYVKVDSKDSNDRAKEKEDDEGKGANGEEDEDDGEDEVMAGNNLNKTGLRQKSGAVTAKPVPSARTHFYLKQKFRFQITLVPRENETFDADSSFRNHWRLSCDTEEEMEIWVGVMKDICPSCFRDEDEREKKH